MRDSTQNYRTAITKNERTCNIRGDATCCYFTRTVFGDLRSDCGYVHDMPVLCSIVSCHSKEDIECYCAFPDLLQEAAG